MKKLVILLVAVCFSSLAAAVEPQEMLKDPALEARAREVSKLLRCVQCQNENIDDSHAEIARDMRVLVRERIAAGDTNQQIIDYMTSRYGDFVRLKPRFMASTLALWIGPFVILVLGGFIVAARFRQAGGEVEPLTAEEQAIIAAYKDTGEKTS